MSAKPDGGPAFPQLFDAISDRESAPDYRFGVKAGMSLRDHFAAAALTGELAQQAPQNDNFWQIPEGGDALARRCYQIADAMIAERVKP